MVTLVVTLGVFLIAVAPFLIEWTVTPIFAGQVERIKTQPTLWSAPVMVSYFYPFWRVACITAGIILLLTGYAFLKDEKWAWPVALSALSVPCIAGGHMIVPWFNFAVGIPPAVFILVVGLIAYLTILLIPKGDGMQKVTDVVVFILLGLTAAESFVNGFATTRMLLARPGSPMFQGLEWSILTVGGPLNWVATVGIFLSIPLLAARKSLGWYVGLGAGLLVMIANFPTHYVRAVTLDYLYNGILGLALVIVLLAPAFKVRLLGEPPHHESQHGVWQDRSAP
jgi:hypothetical protein